MIKLLLISTNFVGAQSCPSLISPFNGEQTVPVDTSISWEKVDGVTGYIISIGTVSGASDILSAQTSTNFYSPPLGLPDNTLVHVTITLFFFNLPNIVCASQSFTTEDIVDPPNCTTIFKPLNGDVNVNVGTNISWGYVPGADGYTINIGTMSGTSNLVNNLDVGNTLQYSPGTDFLPLTQFFVEVIPYNENGNLNSCREESFTTGDIAALPSCTNIISPLDGETNVVLSPLIEWEAVSGAIGYTVFIGSSPLLNDVLDGASFFKNSTFVINFEPNTLYFIRVIPFNESGDAIGCLQWSFSTILGCGPFFDPLTGLLTTLNPEINFPDQVGICIDKLSTEVSSTDLADGYRWYLIDNDGSEILISDTNKVNISDTGSFRYEAYNYGLDSGNSIQCSSSKEFTVVASESPTIIGVNINDVFDGIEIRVQTSGIGNYEYAVGNPEGPYQESNYFNNVPSETSSIYVRDKNGCGIDEFIIVNTRGFPKYFTPNGDSINDFWQYRPADGDDFSLISIDIYDRFGRLIKQITPNSIGWNGTKDGSKLPSSDYWYKAVTSDGTLFYGHFTLKR